MWRKRKWQFYLRYLHRSKRAAVTFYRRLREAGSWVCVLLLFIDDPFFLLDFIFLFLDRFINQISSFAFTKTTFALAFRSPSWSSKVNDDNFLLLPFDRPPVIFLLDKDGWWNVGAPIWIFVYNNLTLVFSRKWSLS